MKFSVPSSSRSPQRPQLLISGEPGQRKGAMMSQDRDTSAANGLSRRDLLRRMGYFGAAALASPAFLAACGSDSKKATTTTTATGTGTGATGGSTGTSA